MYPTLAKVRATRRAFKLVDQAQQVVVNATNWKCTDKALDELYVALITARRKAEDVADFYERAYNEKRAKAQGKI